MASMSAFMPFEAARVAASTEKTSPNVGLEPEVEAPACSWSTSSRCTSRGRPAERALIWRVTSAGSDTRP